MLKFGLFYLLVSILSVACSRPAIFIQRDVCEQTNKTTFDGFYNLIKLKCNWKPFVNLMSKPINQQNQTNEPVLSLYEIEFKDQKYLLNQDYDSTVVNVNLFKNIRISKLVMRDLNLRLVDKHAFDSCCSNTLEHLDLSQNKLKRIDLNRLTHLKVLNLSGNQLQLRSSNFEGNQYLRELDLSNNQIEYLPVKVFDNLSKLEKVRLNSNQLETIDSCIFYPLYQNKFFDIEINLLNNSVSCNCDVFYLKRRVQVHLNLVCGSDEPHYYIGKNINDLQMENPDLIKCNNYNDIERRCFIQYEVNSQYVDNYKSSQTGVLVLSVFLTIFIILFLCAYCRISTLNSKLSSLNQTRKPTLTANSLYTRLHQNTQEN